MSATTVAQIVEAYDEASEAETYAELGQAEFARVERRNDSIKTVLKTINDLWLRFGESKPMSQKNIGKIRGKNELIFSLCYSILIVITRGNFFNLVESL